MNQPQTTETPNPYIPPDAFDPGRTVNTAQVCGTNVGYLGWFAPATYSANGILVCAVPEPEAKGVVDAKPTTMGLGRGKLLALTVLFTEDTGKICAGHRIYVSESVKQKPWYKTVVEFRDANGVDSRAVLVPRTDVVMYVGCLPDTTRTTLDGFRGLPLWYSNPWITTPPPAHPGLAGPLAPPDYMLDPNRRWTP